MTRKIAFHAPVIRDQDGDLVIAADVVNRDTHTAVSFDLNLADAARLLDHLSQSIDLLKVALDEEKPE